MCFLVERETLCDNRVKNQVFDIHVVNGWEGQSDTFVPLEDTLYIEQCLRIVEILPFGFFPVNSECDAYLPVDHSLV